MQLETLFEKIGAASGLSALEMSELRNYIRTLDDVATAVKSLQTPGGGILVNSLRIIGGDVVIDDAGIFIKNNAEAALAFGDAENNRGVIYITSTLDNALALVNIKSDGKITLEAKTLNFVSSFVGGLIEHFLTLSDATTPSASLGEDGAQAGRVLLEIGAGTQGARLNLGGGLIDFRTEGASGGSTFQRVRETTATPPDPGAGDAYHLYFKDDKLIIQFNDAGTVRYKFLDLTSTGVTWQHSTSEP